MQVIYHLHKNGSALHNFDIPIPGLNVNFSGIIECRQVPMNPVISILKPVSLFRILIVILLISGIYLYLKFNQYTSFINRLDIIDSPDLENTNYTAPSRIEIKMNVFTTCFIMAPTYRRYIKQMNLKGDEMVMDFGSGAGPAAEHIAPLLSTGEGELTCLDISPTWMKVIKARLEKFQNINFVLGDVLQLDLDENIYDIILIHFVLHDIDSSIRQEIILRLAHVLKEGGKIYIREPRSEVHGMPGEEIQELMYNAGLKEIRMDSKRITGIIPINEGIFQK
jgi:SAM-dependent methyltransferase